MIKKSIDSLWNLNYAEVLPVAHLLRSAFPDRWVRFHTLPESKRYPDSEGEYREIMERHNTLLEDIRDNAEMFLITTSCSNSEIPHRAFDELCKLDPEAEFWKSIPMHEIEKDDDELYWHMYVSQWRYDTGVFDQILKLVAKNEMLNVIVSGSGITSPWLYHPYDGGADIVLSTPERGDTLSAKRKSWLPAESDGL